MPIGDSYSHMSRGKVSALIIRYLGTPDLHTHLRLKPILTFFRKEIHARSSWRVLEVGCGDGVSGFELLKLAQRQKVPLRYTGIDINAELLQKARTLAGKLDVDDAMDFLCVEAENVRSLATEPPDVIVLGDIIEHLKAPDALLRDLRPLLPDHGVCLVSVPTHNYEKVFGAAFHQKVGHVRSGYHLEELNALFATIGGRPIGHRYNTGLIGNLGCAIYYRLPGNRYATALKALALSPFRLLDFYNGPRVSCSLFAAYAFDR